MRLPNFRIYNTQATASMVLGLMSVLLLAILAFLVFKGFTTTHGITYDPKTGMGQFRKPLVFATTAVAGIGGGVAGLLGFASLGQRRNTMQGRSWLGMTMGAIVVAITPALFFAWRLFSQPVIHDMQ